jgi:hypothetical protein
MLVASRGFGATKNADTLTQLLLLTCIIFPHTITLQTKL